MRGIGSEHVFERETQDNEALQVLHHDHQQTNDKTAHLW